CVLEIGELGDLHAVEHHLPADAPGTERRRLPIVLFEPDVVLSRIDSAGLQAFEIDLLDIVGGRFENHLKLMVLEYPVGIFTKTTIRRTPRRLYVADIPVR